jgi:hypothetical protein
VKRATPRNADGTKKVMSSRTENTTTTGNATSSNSVPVMDPSMFMQQGGVGAMGNPMAAMAAMMGGGNAMYGGNQQQQSSFDPQMMAQFFQQQNWGNANFNPMAFQQMMMGGMGAMGMGGMGMGGMGMGMGMGGMSPWIGGNMGSMSPAGGVASPNNATTAAYGGNGMRSTQSQERTESSNQSNRGRIQAPTSAGLPSRPNIQANKSPDPSTSGGGGRDYSREKSPERGGRGGYNRDNRW